MAAQGTITLNPGGTVRFDTTCILCDKPNSIDGLDPKAVAAFLAGDPLRAADAPTAADGV